jgi:hypothetical protein
MGNSLWHLKGPYVGQLVAPTVPVIGIANPADRVLQQVPNTGEPANIPYRNSQNSQNSTNAVMQLEQRITRTPVTKAKRGRNQKLIVSHHER